MNARMGQRLFVAIPLPTQYGEMLAEVAAEIVKNGRPNDRLRAIPAKNLHITVRFLGWVDEKDVETVGNAVERGAAGTGNFILGNPRITVMPVHSPRMVWCTFGHSEEYVRFVARITRSLKTAGITMKGFDDRSIRECIAHVTLIRGKRISETVMRKIPEIPHPGFVVRVMACMVYSSVLRRFGPVYEEVRRFRL